LVGDIPYRVNPYRRFAVAIVAFDFYVNEVKGLLFVWVGPPQYVILKV